MKETCLCEGERHQAMRKTFPCEREGERHQVMKDMSLFDDALLRGHLFVSCPFYATTKGTLVLALRTV